MPDLKFMPHQLKVLNTTEQFNHVGYYLDMGLGKTFVGAEKLWELNNPVNIVVCQKSKVDDWLDHFRTYYPQAKTCDLTKKSESITFNNLIDAQVLTKDDTLIGVINYDLIFRRSIYLKYSGFTLMLDESSLISNESTSRAKYILKMHPESVILLSGTPTAGKYEKLWSQCQLLGWNITKTAFWGSYVQTTWVEDGTFKRQVITGYKNVDHLKRKLAQHGCIFMKTEEVIQLPDRVEQKIFVPATKEYRKFMKNSYLMLDTLNLQEFHDESDFDGKDVTPRVELVGDNQLTKLLCARQLCGQYHKDKLDAFRDLIESSEERWIVFYNFNDELTRLKKIAEALNRPTSEVNGHDRDLDAYEHRSDSITFIQYQAGAMGGNYQKSCRICYFTLPLGKGSCDLWEQSKKRIHRIGQQNTCFYYYLLVKGSIEERNLQMLKVGKELTDDLFRDQTHQSD